ncbi:hypothetical protein K0M31_001246 [Melipona bicolor]|uniref:Uncharacterized protein n=1 Tax=Melipona bicolor TaxID=60889 RepID=A0AA40GGB7_9HYME|nr:hypothetical protein K0M31_001246 [Melipona bicolor]
MNRNAHHEYLYTYNLREEEKIDFRLNTERESGKLQTLWTMYLDKRKKTLNNEYTPGYKTTYPKRAANFFKIYLMQMK